MENRPSPNEVAMELANAENSPKAMEVLKGVREIAVESIQASEITEENFGDHFFPANDTYKPKKGQVLACWRAKADFVDGWVKRNVIELLCVSKVGAETATKVMTKMVHATNSDAVEVLVEMAKDLRDGLTVDEVADKPYRFTVEQFYWTSRSCVPDDPHWEIINVVDLTKSD